MTSGPTHLFAYGSLMWNPGPLKTPPVPALARNWKRSWCVQSTHHRGTPEHPGLVLGLVEGGSCVGLAYPINERERDALEEIDRRELSEEGYVRTVIDLQTPRGLVQGLAYASPGVALNPPTDGDVLKIIATARGISGSNLEYAVKTAHSLKLLSAPADWPEPCPAFCEKTLLKGAAA